MTAGAPSVILSQKQFFFNLDFNESKKIHWINKKTICKEIDNFIHSSYNVSWIHNDTVSYEHKHF